MDALSQLVRLLDLQASLDLHCQFADGFAVSHERVMAREIEFHLLLAGRCIIEIDGHEPVAMAAGDFLALPGRQAHRVRCDGPIDPGHLLATTEDASQLPLRHSVDGLIELDLLCGRFVYNAQTTETLLQALPSVLHVSLSESTPHADLDRIVSFIRAEVDGARPGAAAVVASLCGALFTLALRTSSQREGLTPSLLRLVGDSRLARATQAMLGSPGRDWTLAQLADLAAMSRATFARRFMQAAATTPGALLLEVRMSRAAGLLRGTRRSVADIGAEIGYQSEAAFSKAFRRAMAVTPSAFRRGTSQPRAGAVAR